MNTTKKHELDFKNYFNLTANIKNISRLEASFNRIIKEAPLIKKELLKKRILLPLVIVIASFVLFLFFMPKAAGIFRASMGIGIPLFYYSFIFFSGTVPGILLKVILSYMPGILVIGFSGAFGSASSLMLASASFHEYALGIGVSGIAIFGLENFITFLFFKKYMPQKLELDYAMKVYKGILGEFPDEHVASISFNPFLNKWSEVALPATRKRAGYKYNLYMDLISQLSMKISDQLKFDMRIINIKEEKIKNRKNKFKGCKYKTIYQLTFKYPAIERLQNTNVSKQLWQKLEETYKANTASKEKGLIPGTVFPNPFISNKLKIKAIIKPRKFNIAITLKSANYERNELRPENLLPPILVLAAIRFATTTLMNLEKK